MIRYSHHFTAQWDICFCTIQQLSCSKTVNRVQRFTKTFKLNMLFGTVLVFFHSLYCNQCKPSYLVIHVCMNPHFDTQYYLQTPLFIVTENNPLFLCSMYTLHVSSMAIFFCFLEVNVSSQPRSIGSSPLQSIAWRTILLLRIHSWRNQSVVVEIAVVNL